MTKKLKISAIPGPHGLTKSAPDFAQSAVQAPVAPMQRPAPVANMMGHIPSSAPTASIVRHSPPSEKLQFEQESKAPLSSDAELANQALCQLNNAIINTQAQGGEKPSLEPLPLVTPTDPPDSTQDEVQLITIPPAPDLKAEAGFIHQVPLRNEIFSQPAASSLVSPPASSHNDAGRTPPAPETKLTPSSSSSRHSSRHPKQVQRYTPESGSTRRASSSSDVADTMAEKSASLIKRIDTTTVNGEVDGSPKRVKPRLSSENFADEESLRLIKELQAQDYGLRRRARA